MAQSQNQNHAAHLHERRREAIRLLERQKLRNELLEEAAKVLRERIKEAEELCADAEDRNDELEHAIVRLTHKKRTLKRVCKVCGDTWPCGLYSAAMEVFEGR